MSGLFLLNKSNNNLLPSSRITETIKKPRITMYKSPSCGCCVGYSKALKERGFEVNIVSTEDMESIKTQYGISPDMESCHTSVIGDYFIEGHVPFEAVDKLLLEKPNIKGIALPNMPAGTPGMPGVKEDPYTISQLENGVFSEFITI